MLRKAMIDVRVGESTERDRMVKRLEVYIVVLVVLCMYSKYMSWRKDILRSECMISF